MQKATATLRKWLSSLAITIVIVGLSDVAIFHRHLADLDAHFGPLPTPVEADTQEDLHYRPKIEFRSEPMQEVKVRVFQQDFQLIHQLHELPEVAKPLFRYKSGSQYAMADADQPWQMGCVGDGSLPRQRFILGGISKDFAFVLYENGGIAHSYMIEVYRANSTDWQPEWIQYLPHAAHNIDQLRKLIAAPGNSCCK